MINTDNFAVRSREISIGLTQLFQHTIPMVAENREEHSFSDTLVPSICFSPSSFYYPLSPLQPFSQNHRIPLDIIQSNPLGHLGWWHRSASRCLQCLQKGRLHALLFQCSDTHRSSSSCWCGNILFMVIALILSLGASEKSLAPPSWRPLWRNLYGLMRYSLLLSTLNRASSHSFFSSEFQTPHHLCGLCWTLSSNSLSFLNCGDQNWTQYSRCGPNNSAGGAEEPHLQILVLLCSFCCPVAVCAALLSRVNFGCWKAPLFCTVNQDFYSCVSILKRMEWLERKGGQYVIFLHFMAEVDSNIL